MRRPAYAFAFSLLASFSLSTQAIAQSDDAVAHVGDRVRISPLATSLPDVIEGDLVDIHGDTAVIQANVLIEDKYHAASGAKEQRQFLVTRSEIGSLTVSRGHESRLKSGLTYGALGAGLGLIISQSSKQPANGRGSICMSRSIACPELGFSLLGLYGFLRPSRAWVPVTGFAKSVSVMPSRRGISVAMHF